MADGRGESFFVRILSTNHPFISLIYSTVSKLTMRCLIIIVFLFLGCKATNEITQGNRPASYIVLVKYSEQDLAANVLTVLNNFANVQSYDQRNNLFSSEIEATCCDVGDTRIELLREQLRQTAGVMNVTINPRF